MRRILVVDDDLHVGQTNRIWLQHHGFHVSTTDGGPDGVAPLDNGIFDPMTVDAFMPGMRGFEAIGLFHECAPAVSRHTAEEITTETSFGAGRPGRAGVGS